MRDHAREHWTFRIVERVAFDVRDPARLVRVEGDVVELAPAVERPFDEEIEARKRDLAQQRVDPGKLHGRDVGLAPERVIVRRQGALGAQK